MGRLDEKIVLVTGGASGLGKADSMLLAKEGAKVVLTDVSDAGVEVAERIVNELGGDATFLQHDVTDEDQWVSIIEKVVSFYGGLDVLVRGP